MRFALPGGGHALFTTCEDGNLSTLRGATPEQGSARRDELRARLGLRWLCASRQVHGATVQRVVAVDGRDGKRLALDADGHATALRGVGAMVLVADCLPVILLADGVVAALHAGWRGLAAGVLEEGVGAVRELGARGEITALVGPGARGCCYEVGEEVHAVFGDADGRGAHRRGRNLDLAAIAGERLRAVGAARVEDVGVCTICDPRFFSHRREGLGAGRQAGIAWLS
ncbi:MAG TPA: polyphenol oxidase family protein [Solirubrobacteraceae bacterium]|jgi:YfiH family protein|nr:polyphenol oxidase family protein [Solirubrobacteraceae bacterium]